MRQGGVIFQNGVVGSSKTLGGIGGVKRGLLGNLGTVSSGGLVSVDTGAILHRALTQETWRDASLFPVVWHGDLINQLEGLEVFFAVPDDDEEQVFLFAAGEAVRSRILSATIRGRVITMASTAPSLLVKWRGTCRGASAHADGIAAQLPGGGQLAARVRGQTTGRQERARSVGCRWGAARLMTSTSRWLCSANYRRRLSEDSSSSFIAPCYIGPEIDKKGPSLENE